MKYISVVIVIILILQTPLIIFGDIEDLRGTISEENQTEKSLKKDIGLTLLSTILNLGTMTIAVYSYVFAMMITLSEYNLERYKNYIFTYIIIYAVIIASIGLKSFIYNLYLIYNSKSK